MPAKFEALQNYAWNTKVIALTAEQIADKEECRTDYVLKCQSQLDIGGQGVVATTDLAAHQMLMGYGGRTSNEPLDNKWDYFLEERDEKKWYLVSESQNSLAMYINSSGVPNCTAVWQRRGDEYRATIITLRPIAKGQELTWSYMHEVNEVVCSQRMALVLRVLHSPPKDGKEDKRGLTLCRYGTRRSAKLYNLKWTSTPGPNQPCWSMQAEGSMDTLEYFWKKHHDVKYSQWLAWTPPAKVTSKKDWDRIVPFDAFLRHAPCPDSLLVDRMVAEGAARKVAMYGKHFRFCRGDTTLCACFAYADKWWRAEVLDRLEQVDWSGETTEEEELDALPEDIRSISPIRDLTTLMELGKAFRAWPKKINPGLLNYSED